jgi:hypothetical protein
MISFIGASLTVPPRPGGVTRSGAATTLPAVRTPNADAWARRAFVALCAAFAIGILVYPTYPVYDSYYDLLWGRELLHGVTPHFQGFRLPTEHPLAIAAGALLSLFGQLGDRLWIALTFAAWLALVAAVYRLGRLAFTPLVGAAAAALLLSRFTFGFLAARGYIDIPYMALVVWAVALEAARPHRGRAVFALLAAAGLLRPEAWLLSGLYFLWMSWRASWRERLEWAAWTAAAPLIWCGVDAAVTGDPLFSLHYTSGSAEDLGRSRTLSQLPGAVPSFLADLVKLPVLLAGVAGLAAALLAAPRRAAWPLVLLLSGIGTFLAIGIAGLSVIERYLILASLATLIFAAVAIGGWTMLQPSRLRTAWQAVSALIVVGGLAFTVTHVHLDQFDQELRFRGNAHAALRRLLHAPAVQAGLRCGPLTLPNHKLVPDSRWISGLPFERVWSRAESYKPQLHRAHQQRGVAVYVVSRYAIFKHAWTDPTDPAIIQVPPAGWRPVYRTPHYAAYVRC